MPRLWRVHHAGAAGISPQPLRLEPAEANHVHRVLRLRTGEALGVFDGAGNEWIGTLVSCDASGVAVRLDELRTDRVEATLALSLFQGPCRPDRMDWVVQKATEVGAAAVFPSSEDRGAGGSGKERRLERWRRIALEACKQSGRRVLPRIEERATLPAIPGPEVLGLALDTAPGSQSLASRMDGPRPAQVWIAVGPEGGFDESERMVWGGLGWLPTSLGPRILRTETAGIVAASILLHRWADLGV